MFQIITVILFSQGAVGLDGPKGDQVCFIKPAIKMNDLRQITECAPEC